MAKYCPILNEKVTYLYCQECDDKICENIKQKEIKTKEISKKENTDE